MRHVHREATTLHAALAAAVGLGAAACSAGADDGTGSGDADADARLDDSGTVDLGGDACDPAFCEVRCIDAGYAHGTCLSADQCSCTEDGADADADADADHPDDAWGGDACAAERVTAERAIAPVDVIWVVDSSGSMDWENNTVRDNLNAFSASISASGIDHHVVLIGNRDEMDVPPPLGGSPYFLHINDSVGSNEALELVVGHYPDYQAFLRPDAAQHFVAVTDDESDMSADDFVAALGRFTDPGFPPGWKFHSIVAQGPIFWIGCITGARIGAVYLDLTARTGGVTASVCETDWSPVFAALEEAVGVPVELPCVFDIPEPPEGMSIDPDRVNLNYTPAGGATTLIPRVADPGACGDLGWYYDDPAAPTQIIVCPATCDTLRADPSGTVDVAFGCATIFV